MASAAPIRASGLTLPRDVLATLLEREPVLARYGLWLLAAMVPVLAASIIDPRTLNDTSVWMKPAKFLLSVALYALTVAWFFGQVRLERRRSRPMRGVVWAIVVAGSLEIAYIAVQAGRGLESHFNRSSVGYEILYGAMGVVAIALVGTSLVVAWEIARRPAPGFRTDYVAAVVIGLALCTLLGGGLGFYMAQQAGHSVGAVGGHVPGFGWNRSGGDLRIAHFLGIHVQQAIPLLAIAASGLPSKARVVAIATGTALYVALTMAVFIQAVDGIALIPA